MGNILCSDVVFPWLIARWVLHKRHNGLQKFITANLEAKSMTINLLMIHDAVVVYPYCIYFIICVGIHLPLLRWLAHIPYEIPHP